jgi:amidase
MNPCFETATRLARAIRNGRLSSVDATQAHLQRIERLNGPINALVVVDRDGALKAARAADRAQAKKKRLGPLHGVPITIKEAFDVAGLHTTSSHPPLKDNVAREDASLVARLRAAGAVILGKTNVPELMPVMPDAAFIRQKQSQPLVIDGTPHSSPARPTTSSPT